MTPATMSARRRRRFRPHEAFTLRDRAADYHFDLEFSAPRRGTGWGPLTLESLELDIKPARKR